MQPLFSTANAKPMSSHLVYPINGINGAEDVYTVKGDGLQEDVVLNKPVKTPINLSYKLNLPSYLAARSLPDGAIGIYSANPVLFSNISYGDNKDKQLLSEAKQNGQKNYLLFALLPPVVKSSGTLATDSAGSTTRLELRGHTLTLEASNLQNLTYPVDIDPSILVTLLPPASSPLATMRVILKSGLISARLD